MIVRIFKKSANWRKNKHRAFVEPDEIFLDSHNLQKFDRQQFEGRIEKPISKKTVLFLGSVFLGVIVVFGVRLIYLQVAKGASYLARSENNTLERISIFADRGIIYDRNKKELAWNQKEDGSALFTRSYLSPGFAHVLGYVSYPATDKTGHYWQSEFVGLDGLEQQYNDKIKGENGSTIVEKDALGEIQSENMVNTPEGGEGLVTTLDYRLQTELFTLLKNSSVGNSFVGGAGIIMDLRNGEILTATSFPEYDSEILSQGEDEAAINAYLSDKRKFFLDRVSGGVYTPGSIVKPFFALGALAEGVIDPSKKILSTGSISIPNPYFPGQKTIFKDWRVNGWTDMREAIAVSSDVYFYEVGGGFEGQRGLGIANLEKYARLFGIGESTGVDLPDEKEGVIPSPQWKEKNFKGDPWRVGDTYHTAIGQYGFQVTPIEMVRAVAAIGNGGTLLTPHFLLGDKEKEGRVTKINLSPEYFTVVKEGMRMAVTSGTAAALGVPYVEVAAKTGTAEVGITKSKVHSWVVGFWPYENPRYAFTMMMEAGPASGFVSASSIMRQLLDWMYTYVPEYFSES